jgi:hypothetical protein
MRKLVLTALLVKMIHVVIVAVSSRMSGTRTDAEAHTADRMAARPGSRRRQKRFQLCFVRNSPAVDEPAACHSPKREPRPRALGAGSREPRKPAILEESVGHHFHERMTVKALPGSALEVIKTKFFFQLLVSLLADPSRLDGGR